MNAAAQYVPVVLTVVAVCVAVIYSNSRMTDLENLIKSEANGFRGDMRGVRNEITSFRNELSRVETSIRADLAHVDQHLERLLSRRST